VLRVFHRVTLVFQNIILTTGSPSDITADVQIPMMLLVILRVQMTNLISVLDFAEKFSS
jgi:hypothetical protein